MSALLITIWLIVFAVISLKNFKRSLWLLFFLLPTYLIRFKLLVPTTLLELMIVVVVVVWLKNNGRQLVSNLKNNWQTKTINRRYPFDWLLVLILLSAFIGCAVSHFSAASLGIFKAYFVEPMLLYLIIVSTYQEQKELKNLIWPLAWSSVFISLIAILQKLTRHFIAAGYCLPGASCRATAIFGYPNAVGLFLAPLIWLMIGLAIENKKFLPKIFLFGTSFLSLLAIVAASSRGAIIGLVIGSIFFCLFSPHKKFNRICAFALVACGLMITLVAPIRQKAYQQIMMTDLSGQIRLQLWGQTWQMLNAGKLILGAGLSNFQAAITPYSHGGLMFNQTNDPNFIFKTKFFPNKYHEQFWTVMEVFLYPHNIILNFWSELGLLGLLSFMILLVLAFIKAVRASKNSWFNLALVAAVLTIFGHGLVDVPYFKNDLAIIFWLIIALIGTI